MNKQDILKIGAVVLVIILVVVGIIIMTKKDNYEYPNGVLYAPSGTAPWMRKPGDGGPTINQSSYTSALVVDQTGNMNITAAVPIGGIIMWAGSINSIPSGWGLCNGSTYGAIVSPDLTSKFVVGAGQSASAPSFVTQYGVGDIGGEEFHQLTIEEIPSHSHPFPASASNSQWTGDSAPANGGLGVDGQATGNTSDVGGDGKGNTLPHNNMPPYYALAYIIKYE